MRYRFWHLMFLCPSAYRFKVLTLVFRVEVDKSLRTCWIPPYLSQRSRVKCTHQLLADDIETMRDVVLDDIVVVNEGSLAESVVVVVVVVERLTNEVLEFLRGS